MSTESQNMLKSYRELQEKYQKDRAEARKSPTYLTTGRVEASSSDLERSVALRKMEKEAADIISKYQSARWYGTEEEQKKRQEDFDKLTPKEKRHESMISKVLHGVSTPLYGMVGAAEAVLGKGSKPGFANIVANIKERETFGDLIRKYGHSNWLATPFGLALDIALDPLNWATLGTGALIPRIAFGAYKGGLAGAKAGVVSGAASKASKVAKYTPVLRKEKEADKLAQFASRQMDWYDSVVGNDDITKQLPQTRAVSGLVARISDYIRKTGKKDAVDAAVKYDPLDPIRKSMKDEDNLRGIPQVFSGEEAVDFERRRMGRGFLDDLIDHEYIPPEKLAGGEAAKAANILDDPDMFVSDTAAQNAARLAQEAHREREIANVVNQIQEMAQNKTGIRLVDETKEKIGKWLERDYTKVKKVLDATLDGYKVFIANFKIAKVAMSPTAYTNALLGNAIMTKMAGIDLSPKLRSEIYQAMKMLNGRKVSADHVRKYVSNPEVADWIEKYPRTFAMAFGISPDVFRDQQLILNKIMQMKIGKVEKDKLLNIVEMADQEIATLTRPLGAGKQAGRRAQQAGSELSSAFYTMPTTYSADVLQGMQDVQQRLLKRLDAVNTPYAKQFAGWYKWMLTKPMNFYESVDQGYKLGIFTHLSGNGISRKELDLLKKMLPLSGADDVRRVPGYDLYTLSPQKAVEASQEIYMNYRAMPGVVKVLRSTPILGAPFASFMYAMAIKSVKTAGYNPSFFTKMNSLMQEVSGGQDPAERKHLESVYNAYLNQPGMLRLPFFRENPAYLRVEQMLPYYSLNIFQPSGRDLESPMARMTTEAIDKVGLFSDPAGQVLFNYFVLPAVLDDEAPKGIFGNKLYPSDATFTQRRIAYPIRDLVESNIPPTLAPLGTVAGLLDKQPARLPGDPLRKAVPIPGIGTEEYMPSFRYRNFARAARGQTSVGVGAKEDPLSRWVRNLSGWLGFPIYRTEVRTKDITNE